MKAYNSAHLLFSLIKAISRNDWPESFKLAPINGDWTARALKGTFIPDIAPRLIGLPPEYPASTITGCNNPNAWALTYDDGPGPYTFNPAQTNRTDPRVAIPRAVQNQLTQPQKGTISLQHDLFYYAALCISPVIQLLEKSSYTLMTVPRCSGGFPEYGSVKLTEILSNTPSKTNPGTEMLTSTTNATINIKSNSAKLFSCHTLIVLLIFLILI